MGTSSAKPGKLQTFVDAAAEIRGELEGRIRELRASYDAFQSSGSTYVGNPDLMDVELPGLVTNYQNDEVFVAVVRAAFLRAGSSADPDGLVTADTAAFNDAFTTVATEAGIDPAALLADRDAVTIDVPIAAGTPQTSGFVADPVCTATGHFVEGRLEAVPLLAQVADALHDDEGGVPLVEVIDGRLCAHRLEDADAADPENDLLLHARVAVAAIEARRELSIPRRVLLEVGVEQIQRHTPDAYLPYRHEDSPVAERDRSDAGFAFLRHRRFNRRFRLDFDWLF